MRLLSALITSFSVWLFSFACEICGVFLFSSEVAAYNGRVCNYAVVECVVVRFNNFLFVCLLLLYFLYVLISVVDLYCFRCFAVWSQILDCTVNNAAYLLHVVSSANEWGFPNTWVLVGYAYNIDQARPSQSTVT